MAVDAQNKRIDVVSLPRDTLLDVSWSPSLFCRQRTTFSASSPFRRRGPLGKWMLRPCFHPLPGDGAGYYKGASYYVLDREAVLELVNTYFNPYQRDS